MNKDWSLSIKLFSQVPVKLHQFTSAPTPPQAENRTGGCRWGRVWALLCPEAGGGSGHTPCAQGWGSALTGGALGLLEPAGSVWSPLLAPSDSGIWDLFSDLSWVWAAFGSYGHILYFSTWALKLCTFGVTPSSDVGGDTQQTQGHFLRFPGYISWRFETCITVMGRAAVGKSIFSANYIFESLFCYHLTSSISNCTTAKKIPPGKTTMPTGCTCSPHTATRTLTLMTEFTFLLLQITQHSTDWNQPPIM